MNTPGSPATSASVVVPAHNEESVISRCLASLVDGATLPESLDVVVVANGCTDATAARARVLGARLSGLRVLEREQPGKIGALNAGDEAATTFPRVYLDADIELGPGALDALIASLDTDRPRVASPHAHFDLEHCSLLVKAFYRAFVALPYATDALIGLGVYGVSRGGRARFDRFPDVIADDLFVDRLFTPAERVQSAGTFTVRAPRSLSALLAVRTRVARGNVELARTGEALAAPSTASTVRGLLGILARRPWAVLDVATYVVVTAVSRSRARRAADGWLRDDSTR